MKLEIKYEITEITRYVITRNYSCEGGGSWSSGFVGGNSFGEFERRADAEKVCKALEAIALNEASRAL